MSLTYATPADLATWTGSTTPENATELLRSASGLVTAATRTAVYDVDPDGQPTAPDVVAAFRDATCAQAATWAALGIDPATLGLTPTGSGGPVASMSRGSASITYAGAEAAAATRASITTQLTPEARTILASANLPASVQVRG
ncbi:hypothetical protein CLV28_0707 [Sediminihabitans luteus]|uniref:Uncharacterized protein n=1 Tax=Sediminihabitans luteus TaxID=1138585 RepID=A0A2M9D0F0_9CELL|nr:hypothetical protein [Sediminihabitans luteus]PJJ77488.1 hypothetical protein CLV28_0707 [Sediminihabitans luteus]GII98384.1 hypothetical protein Slu03_07620 [Sediminihabitans luteus]